MPARSLARSVPLGLLLLGASCGGGVPARSTEPRGLRESAPVAASAPSAPPTTVLAAARRVASNDSFDCAIAASGQLWCWTSPEHARAIGHFEHTRSISQHTGASCAVLDDGTIGCMALVDAIGGPAVVFVDDARYAWTDVPAVSRIASPCVVLSADRSVECRLPESSPSWLADPMRRAYAPRPRTPLGVGPARDLAATPSQLCVVDDAGTLSCLQLARRVVQVVSGLPPLRSVAMGLGCGELVCGITRGDELVCFAAAGGDEAGLVRVPGVRDVAVDGCTVCMASIDGQLACFGDRGDDVPFASSPRPILDVSGVVQVAVGPRGGVALTQDEQLLAFDPHGRSASVRVRLEGSTAR